MIESFEFEEKEASEPEIMDFEASQQVICSRQLHNSNQEIKVKIYYLKQLWIFVSDVLT